MNTPLADVLRHNRRADLAPFKACRPLTDAQRDARLAGTFALVRGLHVRVAGGQQTCVLCTRGRRHEGKLNRTSSWPGGAALFDIVTRSGDNLTAIAEGMGVVEEVDLPYAGRVYRFPGGVFCCTGLSRGKSAARRARSHMPGVAAPDLDGRQYAVHAGFGREVEPPGRRQ